MVYRLFLEVKRREKISRVLFKKWRETTSFFAPSIGQPHLAASTWFSGVFTPFESNGIFI
jgi:hypothetical protein